MRIFCIAVLSSAMLCCARAEASRQPVEVEMRNVDLHVAADTGVVATDFSVDRWNEQLVAGYSKTTTARGLKAHMPDYNDLKVRRK